MKQIAFTIDKWTFDKLAELGSMGFNRSALVREALKAYLTSDYIKHLTEIVKENKKDE